MGQQGRSSTVEMARFQEPHGGETRTVGNWKAAVTVNKMALLLLRKVLKIIGSLISDLTHSYAYI